MAVHKWRIYCNTDSKFEYTGFQEAAPTVCPVNGGHSVDTSNVAEVEAEIPTLRMQEYAFNLASSNSASYEKITAIIFSGTDSCGTAIKVKIIAFTDATSYDIKIYDVTNSLTIVEKTGMTNTAVAIIDLGVLANLSTGEAIWELQVKRAGGGSCFIDMVQLEY